MSSIANFDPGSMGRASDYVRRRRAGEAPDAIMPLEANRRAEEEAAELMRNLQEREQQVVQPLSSLVQEAELLDPAREPANALERLVQRIEQLKLEKGAFQANVKKTDKDLDDESKHKQQLMASVASYEQNLERTHSRYRSPMVTFGDKICTWTSNQQG